ncbi:MAG: M28 family peptidase [Candidatus Zixiibacteriota bacterium]
MKKLLFLIILFVIAISSLGDNLSGIHPYRRALMDSVDFGKMWENLSILAGESDDDRYVHIPSRHSHYPGFSDATSYIATKFTEMGYEPVLDSFDIGIDIFALDYTTGIIAASGRHSVFYDQPALNLADSTIAKYPFIQDVLFVHPDTGYAIGIGSSGGSDYYSALLKYTPDDGWQILRTDDDAPLYAITMASPDTLFICKINGSVLRYIRSESDFSETSAASAGLYDIAFLDNMTGITCGAGGFVAYTEDGGETWSESMVSAGVTFVCCDYNNYGVPIIAGTSGAMYKRSSETMSFTRVLLSITSDINDVFFDIEGNGYFVTSDGKLYTSFDGGDIWSQLWRMPESGEFGFDNSLSSVAAFYDDIYIAGERSIYLYSDDGGLTFDFVERNDKWANVYVDIDAHPGWFSDTVYGMTAHYDAVSENPFARAPGADDNGTGTVIVMEAARVLQNQTLRHSGRFLLCAGEEVGLTGAMHHRRATADTNWGGIVNVDQVGYPSSGVDSKIKVNGDWSDESREFAFRLIDAIEKYVPEIIAEPTGATSTLYSDHYPFQEAGIRAVTMEEYNRTPHYHTIGDTMGNIDSVQFYHAAKAAIASMIDVCYPVANMTGRVGDGNTDLPIENATVSILEREFTTDSTGMFFFTQLPRGDATMRATAPGYDTLEMDIFVSGGVVEMWYDMYLFSPGEREGAINFSSITMDDTYGIGDGDGFVDPGERLDFFLTVYSTLPETTYDITGVMTNFEGDGEVLDSIVEFPNIHAFDRIRHEEPFRVRISYAFSIYDEISFDITLYSGDDSLLTEHFSFGGESIWESPIVSEKPEYSIYPNPTRGRIRIKNMPKKKMELYDIKGCLLGTIPANMNQFDIEEIAGENLEPGIYLLKTESDFENATKIILMD